MGLCYSAKIYLIPFEPSISFIEVARPDSDSRNDSSLLDSNSNVKKFNSFSFFRHPDDVRSMSVSMSVGGDDISHSMSATTFATNQHVFTNDAYK
jgi:hypothetical protein